MDAAVPPAATFAGPLSAVFSAQAGAAPGSLATALADLLVGPDVALPVAPATDRTVWGGVGALADRATLDGIRLRAEAERSRPWPQPLASDAARVHRDGDRDTWEQIVYERQRRLTRAAVRAAETLDDAEGPGWLDEVADGVVLVCEQSSWCWPAHDDTRARHGSVLATVTDPFLDLGAGEVVGQLAWLDHLLGDSLDARYPGVRVRIRHEARVRVFDPFLSRRDWHWLGLDGDVHNWNPWIHGNVLVAALRLLDGREDAARRAQVVALCIEGIDRYVAVLPADGAIDEGYSYWWNGACRALEALDVLRHATGGRLDAVPAVGSLRETVAFPHRSHLGGAWYLNLADGQAKPSADQPWHALHRAARSAGDDAARAHAASHRTAGAASEIEGLGRLLRGMTDAAWLAARPETSPLPRDVWLASTDVLLSRQDEGRSDGLTLAVKGGHNGENHNHNDVGSFVVASGGVPVLIDAGRPTYTAQTFGPQRYDIWTMQSSWHNVPGVRGAAQSAGAPFAASEVEASIADDMSQLHLEIAAAYGTPGLRSWRRTAVLDRIARRVRISDAWQLDPWTGSTDEPATTVRLLVAGTIESVVDGVRITPVEPASRLRVRWPSEVTATFVERTLEDPMLREVWGDRVTRIDLDVTARSELTVTVERDDMTGEDEQ